MGTLKEALGGMTALAQWFVWRLTWDAAENKYQKIPAYPSGNPRPMDAAIPSNWMSHDAACVVLQKMRGWKDGHQYALGFYLTADSGYWFLDIDKCVHDGVLSPLACELASLFPGAAGEYSSSGNGLHLFGRGMVPAHRCRNTPLGLEFYTEQRGIAFGLHGQAWGNADSDHSSHLWHTLVPRYFAPEPEHSSDALSSLREDWRGPSDDDELLRRALNSKSVGSMLGGKASFADLFHNNVAVLDRVYGKDSESERDAALASHLAFWTGCDEERMERLMRRSGLMRAKWDEHRTYLRKLTIGNAIARCTDVYCEREREAPKGLYEHPAAPVVSAPSIAQMDGGGIGVQVAGENISAEQMAACERLLDLIGASSDLADIHNRIIPTIRAARIVPALLPRIESAVNKRLELYDAKLPVSKLRTLINPPLQTVAAQDAPPFVSEHVYVTASDKFFNVKTGSEMTRSGFCATYNRIMPMRDTGMREDAAQWSLERWNMQTVNNTMYHPGESALFTYGGLLYANTYNVVSLPAVPEHYTQMGVEGIDAFMKHLNALCNDRHHVSGALLCWMAHNVQYPGVKILWAPIIKGVEGDGKSMLARVLMAAMGAANVSSIGPQDVANEGGFTSWAHGSAVVMLEELMLTGSSRYRVSNLLKPYLTNPVVGYTRKGRDTQQVLNTTNYIASTNFNDAIPIADNERRWMVVFTPWPDRLALALRLGLYKGNDKDEANRELDRHFACIFNSLKAAPGEWRKWLLSIEIPATFDPNANAPYTDEKAQMAASSRDDAEQITRDVIEENGYGITRDLFSSGCVSSLLKVRSAMEGFDMPQSTALAHMYTRMGYSQLPRPVKWDGRTHRIWVRNGVTVNNDKIRELLELTKATCNL